MMRQAAFICSVRAKLQLMLPKRLRDVTKREIVGIDLHLNDWNVENDVVEDWNWLFIQSDSFSLGNRLHTFRELTFLHD